MLIRFPFIKNSSLLINLEAIIVYSRLQYTLVCTSFVSISREKKTLNILVMERKFGFPYVDV